MSRLIGRVLVAGAFVLLVVGWLHLKVSLDVMRAERPYIYEAGYSLPGPQLVRAGTLNFRTAAADMVWVGGVQFVAQSMHARQNVAAVTDYAETIIALDPLFYKVYGWHSAARMLAVGYPTPEDIEVSNDILAVGMDWFPNDWRLPYEATANYIGFNRGVDDKTRIEQLKRGIEFAEAAAAIPGSPETVAGLALSFRARLRRLQNKKSADAVDNSAVDDGAADLERTMLIHLYSLTTNQQARESILNRLRHVDGAEELVSRLKTHGEKQQAWIDASPINYVPYDLFSAIAGPESARSLVTQPVPEAAP